VDAELAVSSEVARARRLRVPQAGQP
jgi:hypothetical protein